MGEYLTDIQITCNSLFSCGHPIEEMQKTSIILNGVKCQFDNVIVVIHAIRKPYVIAFVSSVLLDVESRQCDMVFDAFCYYKCCYKSVAKFQLICVIKFIYKDLIGFVINWRWIAPTATDQPLFQQTNQPSFQQSNSGRGLDRGRGYGNNKMQCQLCCKFDHLIYRCYHRFTGHFTWVTYPSYNSSQPAPSAHLTSAHWDDSAEIDHSSYVTKLVPSSFDPSPTPVLFPNHF